MGDGAIIGGAGAARLHEVRQAVPSAKANGVARAAAQALEASGAAAAHRGSDTAKPMPKSPKAATTWSLEEKALAVMSPAIGLVIGYQKAQAARAQAKAQGAAVGRAIDPATAQAMNRAARQAVHGVQLGARELAAVGRAVNAASKSGGVAKDETQMAKAMRQAGVNAAGAGRRAVQSAATQMGQAMQQAGVNGAGAVTRGLATPNND